MDESEFLQVSFCIWMLRQKSLKRLNDSLRDYLATKNAEYTSGQNRRYRIEETSISRFLWMWTIIQRLGSIAHAYSTNLPLPNDGNGSLYQYHGVKHHGLFEMTSIKYSASKQNEIQSEKW